MKITQVEKWKVVVPCRPGLLEREGRYYDPGLSHFDAIPKWIIRIHTDKGLTGIGESSRGETAASIDSGIEALIGQDPRRLPLQRLPLPTGASYTTFEMAIYDLVGKAFGATACELLGGARQKQVPIDSWCTRRSPSDTGRTAAEARGKGYRSIKIKAALAHPAAVKGGGQGGGTSAGDHSEWAAVTEDDPLFERVAAITEACGPEFGITIDPNCRFYEPARALRVAKVLEGFPNVTVLEDPIPWRDNLDAYVYLRAKCPIPVAIHVSTPDAVLAAIKKNAVDYMNINGSMADFVKSAWMAEQAGIRCWHGSGVDLGIRDMSYLQASFAAGGCTLPGDIVGHALRRDDLITEPLPVENGYARLPAKPGLGVELDEEALARYAVE